MYLFMYYSILTGVQSHGNRFLMEYWDPSLSKYSRGHISIYHHIIYYIITQTSIKYQKAKGNKKIYKNLNQSQY